MTFQGQFNVQTHLVSLVLVHVGVGQRCRAHDIESPAPLPSVSTLPFHRGAVDESSRFKGERTNPALEYTFVLVSVAVPTM